MSHSSRIESYGVGVQYNPFEENSQQIVELGSVNILTAALPFQGESIEAAVEVPHETEANRRVTLFSKYEQLAIALANDPDVQALALRAIKLLGEKSIGRLIISRKYTNEVGESRGVGAVNNSANWLLRELLLEKFGIIDADTTPQQAKNLKERTRFNQFTW